jgi:hypothetical protein
MARFPKRSAVAAAALLALSYSEPVRGLQIAECIAPIETVAGNAHGCDAAIVGISSVIRAEVGLEAP